MILRATALLKTLTHLTRTPNLPYGPTHETKSLMSWLGSWYDVFAITHMLILLLFSFWYGSVAVWVTSPVLLFSQVPRTRARDHEKKPTRWRGTMHHWLIVSRDPRANNRLLFHRWWSSQPHATTAGQNVSPTWKPLVRYLIEFSIFKCSGRYQVSWLSKPYIF